MALTSIVNRRPVSAIKGREQLCIYHYDIYINTTLLRTYGCAPSLSYRAYSVVVYIQYDTIQVIALTAETKLTNQAEKRNHLAHRQLTLSPRTSFLRYNRCAVVYHRCVCVYFSTARVVLVSIEDTRQE